MGVEGEGERAVREREDVGMGVGGVVSLRPGTRRGQFQKFAICRQGCGGRKALALD